jgi:hypothetical protein
MVDESASTSPLQAPDSTAAEPSTSGNAAIQEQPTLSAGDAIAGKKKKKFDPIELRECALAA